MRCCVISLLGRKYCVISGSGYAARALPDGAPSDVRPIFITPSETADFSAVYSDTEDEYGTEPFYISAALSFFFHAVRGLPQGAAEAEYVHGGVAHPLSLFDTGGDKRGIFLPKCKELCTNTVANADGVEIILYELCLAERRRGIFVERPEQLDVSVLRRLLAARGLPILRYALAVGLYEPHELILSPGAVLDLDALSAAAYMLERVQGSALLASEGVSLLYRGGLIDLRRDGDRYFIPVSTEIIC